MINPAEDKLINSRSLLERKDQYVGWVMMIKSKARRNKFVVDNKLVPEKKVDYFDMLIDNLSLQLLGKIKIVEGEPDKLLEQIRNIFGLKTAYEARNDYKKWKMIRNINPEPFLIKLDQLENEATVVGANITVDDKFDILLGESQSSGLIMDFYEDFVHKQRIEYDGKVITEDTIQTIRGELVKYHRNAPKTKRDKFNRRLDMSEAALINFEKKKKKNWEERHCSYCEKNIPSISKSHNTIDCRYKKDDDLDSPK